MTPEINEIRAFVNRAPKTWMFRDGELLNFTPARHAWLNKMASGSLDQRINRRAGICTQTPIWKYPTMSAIQRNQRRRIRRGY
ncbi:MULTISPECIES: hypothetical protein [Comamonadaceae]|uniref:Uncharacterized protein n=1 Tax=Simplicispira suum TaxID=2109915 RepID=A0A2S0N5W7_9BURK|nr:MULTISPECIES: hypothetical protein [Comamonadaceae]ADV02168.1 hypothetical protein Alide_4566 [Alicycliphilus denitrificans BC]AVO43371.1 hypothetical protein C6571_18165 [Simplicispira suum]